MAEILKCVHCTNEDEDFNEKSLWRHYQWRHWTFKIECSRCSNKFHRDCDLDEHMEKSHQKVKVNKTIACVHCDGQTFTSESGLSDHYDDIHRKYKVPCKVCGNRFQNKSILTQHEDSRCLTWQQKG